MKVKVLFSYKTSTVPPRCRNPRSVLNHDGELEVEIIEVDSAQAPVGLRLKSEQWAHDSANKAVRVGTSIDYRWFNGELWTNCKMFGGSRSSHTSRQDDWDYIRPPKLIDLRSEGWDRVGDYRLHLSLDPCRTKEEQENYLRDWAASWLIVKGRPGMWSTAGEPRYVVMTFGLGCNHGGTALMIDTSYNSNIAKDAYFPATQFKEARAAATATAKGRGDLKSLPIKPHGRIQVLIPEAVQCKPQEQAGEGDPFINSAETLISAVKQPVVAAAGLFALLAR